MRYEIIIAENLTGVNPNIYLDTFQEESISLNYNISDIADIANKNSSYSKTIKLPDTGTNRKAFCDIFNLESTSPYWANTRQFNPNKKVKCWILKETIIQFQGNLQLTNIVYNYDTQEFYYECVIYADNDNLYKSIGDKFLSDLDLSAYDHNWTYNNVVQSWTDNWTRGYYYPLIDYGLALNLTTLQSGNRNLTNFLPAIYVKSLVNQIFTEAGYTYKSDFFDGEEFGSLIVPFNNKNLIPSYPNITYDTKGVLAAGGLSSTIDVGSNTLGNVDWQFLGFNTELFDPNGFWNPANSTYTNPVGVSITQRFKLYLSLLITPGNQATNEAPWQSWSDNIRVWAVRSKDANGFDVPNFSSPGYFDFVNYPTIMWDNITNVRQIRSLVDDGEWEKIDVGNNNYVIRGFITTSWFSPALRNNEKVKFFITRSVNNQAANPATIVMTASYFQSEVNLTQASEGAFLEAKNIVPANVKQKDFLTSILRMFNLVIEPDKDIQDNFIIEPKDYYYKKYSVLKDWSDKLDLNTEVNAELLSNLQNKLNSFTYKDDKDFYNQKWKELNNQIFGEYKYDIDNDFIAGEKKIELIFSPTPLNELAPAGSGIYLPSIYQMNNGNITRIEGFNMRILYRKPIALTASNYIKLNGNLQTIYPYAGYVDDPLNPNYSLNFGEVGSFYSGYSETQNNLFYNYYQRTMDLLSDRYGKIITADINLDAYDISSFRFSDLIYLTIGGMSGYYRVNKIIDYDPSKEQPTKVELITAINYNSGINAEVDCPVSLNYCLCGPDLETYLEQVRSYYGTLSPYLTWKSSEDLNYYSFTISSATISALEISQLANQIPGMVSTFNSGSSTCSLNFQVDMGEEATLTFLGTLNDYYDSGPNAYVAIYVNYPCGSTFGTWEENYNAYFIDLNSFHDQYSFLDLWLNLIPGAYGTASGEPLAEGSYLQLGWDWVANCLTASETESSVYFTIELNDLEAQSLVNEVNSKYGTDCPYLTFYNTWAFAAYNFTASTGTNTLGDIVGWANTIFGMSASLLTGGGAKFYYRQDGMSCDNCGKSYVAKLSMNNTIGSPAVTYECYELFLSPPVQNPCVVDCFGEGLQLFICLSNTDYLPGGWTPNLFCDSLLLGPTAGPVFEAGDLSYGPAQNLCICTDETLCFTLTETIACPGGVASLRNYISTAVGEEEVLYLWETFDDCECVFSVDPINYQRQIGNQIVPPQDVVWVGNLNTNSTNILSNTGNIVSGSDNFVGGINNVVSGSGNLVSGKSNIVNGDGNNASGNLSFMLGASLSNTYPSSQPSFLLGNNIQNYSEGSFLFGNNIELGTTTQSWTIGSTSSTASAAPQNLFVIGSDLVIPEIPSNTTFLGTENIILDENGGFNTPFIISEAVNTDQIPSGQTIIKTYTGVTPVVLPSTTYYVFPFTDGTTPSANGVNIVSWEDIRDFSIVQIEFNIRVEFFGAQAFGDPVAAYSNRGAWVKLPNVSGKPDFSLIGTDGAFFVDDNTPAITIDTPNTIYDIGLGVSQPSIEIVNANATDGFVCYYDMTLRYQYSPGGYYH